MTAPDYTTNPPLKRCSKCGIEKPATIDNFPPRKGSPSGLKGTCRICNRIRLRQYRAKNKDAISARTRQKRSTGHMREVDRARYARNKMEYLEYQRNWRKRNPEKHRNIIKRYETKHPQIRSVVHQKRRARKNNLPDQFTDYDWQIAIDYFNGRCAVCGRPQGFWHRLAADHWIPISSPDCPGTIPENMIPLCQGMDGCNNSKHDKPAVEWLILKFGKQKANAILKRIEAYFEWIKKQDD